MPNPFISLRRPMTLSALMALLLTLGGAARADLKVVSESTVTGLPDSVSASVGAGGAVLNGTPIASTSYYKGDKSRIESGTHITITTKGEDGASVVVYTLDTAKKTYTVTSPTDIAKGLADNPMASMFKIDSKVFLNPGTDNRTIANKATKDYRYQATFKMSMTGGDPSINAMLPTIIIKGEEWASEEVALTGTGFGDNPALGMMKMMPPMLTKGFKEFADKLGQIKGYPLRNVVSVTFAVPPGSPIAASLPKEPISTVTEVKSLSEDALADDLFVLPAGYTKVEAPAPPTLPGAPPI